MRLVIVYVDLSYRQSNYVMDLVMSLRERMIDRIGYRV